MKIVIALTFIRDSHHTALFHPPAHLTRAGARLAQRMPLRNLGRLIDPTIFRERRDPKFDGIPRNTRRDLRLGDRKNGGAFPRLARSAATRPDANH